MIAVLDLAQRENGGWLPRAAMDEVARVLDMAPIRVYEVATFYTMFSLRPRGKHLLQVCTTTPCWLRGSDAVMKACHDVTGVGPGEVSADGLFSTVEVECLGACVNAPMAQINYDFYEDLTPENFEKILDDLAAGKSVKPGPQIDRQFSAPVGGPTTLTDGSLYAKSGKSGIQPPLTDSTAKKPTESANVRESPMPTTSIGDSSGKERK